MSNNLDTSIVATESADDVFTFLDIPLNDADRSQLSSQSKESLDISSGRAPRSILKKVPSYSSLSNMGSLRSMGSVNNMGSLSRMGSISNMGSLSRMGSVSNMSNMSNMSDSSPKYSNSPSSGHQICVEEPESDPLQAGSKMKRVSSNVSFQSVDVREYGRTLGDNPSCMSGPPISLDWSYSKTTPVCINEYEDKRIPRSKSQP